MMWIIIFGMLILMILALIFTIVMFKIMFKHRIILREIIGGTPIIRKVIKARDYKDDKGVTYWKTWTYGAVSVPPDSSLSIDYKGKKWASGILSGTGDILWENRTDGIKEYIDATTGILKKEFFAKYQPVNTNQRIAIVDGIEKAKARKGFSWKEHILSLAAFGAFVVIIVAGMIFYSDIAQPAIDAKAIDLQILKINQENLKLIQDLNNKIQTIDSRVVELQNVKVVQGPD